MSDDAGCLGFLIVGVVLFGITYILDDSTTNSDTSIKDVIESRSLVFDTCETYTGNSGAKYKPFEPTDGFEVFKFFLDRNNPFPKSPNHAISKILQAIQERNVDSYQSSFETSTEFLPKHLQSGHPGRFTGVVMDIVESDDQIALVRLSLTWVPSTVGTDYPPYTVVNYCQDLVLVHAEKGLTVMPGSGGSQAQGNITLGGWFLREDQASLLPYDFSSLIELPTQ